MFLLIISKNVLEKFLCLISNQLIYQRDLILYDNDIDIKFYYKYKKINEYRVNLTMTLTSCKPLKKNYRFFFNITEAFRYIGKLRFWEEFYF